MDAGALLPSRRFGADWIAAHSTLDPAPLAHAMLARLILCAVALCFASCATPATPDGMTIGEREYSKLLTQRVELRSMPPLRVRYVTGGSETSAMGSPQVSSADFERALRDSLLYLELQPHEQETAMDLDAELLELELPTAAFDMSAYLTVRYRLYDGSDEPLYDHTIRTGYLVRKEASFTGVDRARLAIEGAARDNINALILSTWTELRMRGTAE